MNIENLYAVFGNRHPHNPKNFGCHSCRCCGWIWQWTGQQCVRTTETEVQILEHVIIAEREPCSCSPYHCERCHSCIDHCTCEVRVHPVYGPY